MSTTKEPQPEASPNGLSPKQKLVDNERVKLMATAFNNGAVAAFVTGIVGPVASELYGITTPKAPYWWAFGLFWMAAAASLHLIARLTLGNLEP
jgi:hypothetical protein